MGRPCGPVVKIDAGPGPRWVSGSVSGRTGAKTRSGMMDGWDTDPHTPRADVVHWPELVCVSEGEKLTRS